MAKAHNDNDELSFISIGAATRNVVRYLEEQRSDPERDTEPKVEAEKDREQERFVQTRLDAIRRFEARYLRNRSSRKANDFGT